jgi:hypothetical protein
LSARRSRLVRGGGVLRSENAGMSSVRDVSKRPHRMAEVSAARFILGGLVGPKPRPKGVGDGQTVDIPLPLADDSVPGVCGACYVERSVGDTASNCAEASFRASSRGRGKPVKGNSTYARLQEKHVWGCRERPYRKPTLVAGHKCAKVDE